MLVEWMKKKFKLVDQESTSLSVLMLGKDLDKEAELMSLSQLKQLFAACGKELRKRTP
jgi:hypothetical protein